MFMVSRYFGVYRGFQTTFGKGWVSIQPTTLAGANYFLS
jgi:hypothetical protein